MQNIYYLIGQSIILNLFGGKYLQSTNMFTNFYREQYIEFKIYWLVKENQGLQLHYFERVHFSTTQLFSNNKSA